eukprot:3639614-Rhodomonas_salina.1
MSLPRIGGMTQVSPGHRGASAQRNGEGRLPSPSQCTRASSSRTLRRTGQDTREKVSVVTRQEVGRSRAEKGRESFSPS